jgi:uncharacterized protein
VNTPGVVGLTAALIAGTAGSIHCLAMCGGMAGALGMRASAQAGTGLSRTRWSHAILYQVGRIGSYALAGLLVSLAGGVLDRAVFSQASAVLRVASGVLLIFLGIRLLWQRNFLAWLERCGHFIWQRMQPLRSHAVRLSGWQRALLLGSLWGWLPCGLVYSMLLFAALAGQPLFGAVIMAAFGLGTLPAMLAGTLASAQLRTALAQPQARAWSAVLLAGCGVWTIAAALQVGHVHHLGN